VSAVDELESVVDWLRWMATRFAGADLYFGHGTDNPWDEALALLRGYLALPHDKLEFVLGARLTARERRGLAELVERRIVHRVPVPYLTGEAWFAGRRYLVTPDVLIPRSPIGELIESGFAPWIVESPQTILDLCAGSGCIGIACAHHFPDATVVLADIDPRAVSLARRNVALHELEDRVEVVESDLYDALDDRTFDLIVTNPPYVGRADLEAMPPEFRHEPVLALGGGEDGLDVVRSIIAGAPAHLSATGSLVGEVGATLPVFMDAFPGIEFEFPILERGGEGVFVIAATRLPGSR